VTTEEVQQTVPVRRERVRVEREPSTDVNLDEDGEIGRQERRRRRQTIPPTARQVGDGPKKHGHDRRLDCGAEAGVVAEGCG
jgi:hypothetical protein